MRCAALRACCPKVRDDDLSPFASRDSAYVYRNPYVQEELAEPHGVISMLDDDRDVPLHATALMYNQFKDMPAPGKSYDEWADEFIEEYPDAAAMKPSDSLPAQAWHGWDPWDPRWEGGRPTSRRPPSKAPDRAADCSNASTRTTDSTASSLPQAVYGTGRAPPPLAREKSRIIPQQPVLGGWDDIGDTTADQEDDDWPPAAASTTTLPLPSVHLRTLSRSLREASACPSEPGGSSIAAIKQCVAEANMVHPRQRPNSDKWRARLRLN